MKVILFACLGSFGLPLVWPKVTTNIELAIGRDGDGIVRSLYTFIPPTCKARVFVGDFVRPRFWESRTFGQLRFGGPVQYACLAVSN